MRPHRPIQSGHDARVDLQPAPIPREHVLDGDPQARSLALMRSVDDGVATGLWDCTAGRFRWVYGTDEIVHIVEGEVTITDQDGRALTLRAGDVAHFEPGTATTWEVPVYVKKVYVERTLPADPLSRAVHALRQWARARLRRGAAAGEPLALGSLTSA